MFYTYAEKQGNVFFEGWEMRQVAFDTMRRHLYYTSAVAPDKIAYPNANDNPLPSSAFPDDPLAGTESLSANSRSTAPDTAPGGHPPVRLPLSPARQTDRFAVAPPPPNNPEDVLWRKKIKVDLIVPVAKEHAFLLEDSHLKESDLFQMEIHGETRPMAPGETPAPGPLLCPSAGLSGMPERCSAENEEFIRDSFFLRELYEALRDQFIGLRLERERAAMASGRPSPPPGARKTQTLDSPRAKGTSAYRGSRIKVVFRMRTDYEFRRFWYVMQTVLGYDKLSSRPYRGLPPYDPRNGIIFASIPMCVWHTFKALDKAVFYTFLRGDLVGRNAQHELCVTLRGAYLCITHDTVIVMRDTGHIPRWIKLQQVREFHYSAVNGRPFVAFLSDSGVPDIIFLPQPPIYGPDAIRRFSPSLEVLRIRHVIHETCFASVDIRRVIDILEVPEVSVRGFVLRYEREMHRNLDFDPPLSYTGVLSCPLPKEQLAQVWREVQDIYASRDPSIVSRAAIPLYENNTNDTDLTREQLGTLSRRLARERSSRDDIVGLPFHEAHNIQPMSIREGAPQRHRHQTPPPLSTRERAHSSGQATFTSSSHREGSSSFAQAGGGEAPVTARAFLRRSQTSSFSAVYHDVAQPPRSRDGRRDTSEVRTAASRNASGTVTASPSSPNLSVMSPTDASGEGLVAAHATVEARAAPAPPPSDDTPFVPSHATLARLPSYRLETPQIGADAGGDAGPDANHPEPLPVFTAADEVVNDSFVSGSQLGGESVQYQLPGARYLTAEEVKETDANVAIDRHTILMSQTPLGGGERVLQGLLSNNEMNVTEIVNKSITALHAAHLLPVRRNDSFTATTQSPNHSAATTEAPTAPPSARQRRSTHQSANCESSQLET